MDMIRNDTAKQYRSIRRKMREPLSDKEEGVWEILKWLVCFVILIPAVLLAVSIIYGGGHEFIK